MSEPKRYIFRIRECGCVKPEHLEGKYAPSALIIEETEEKCGWVRYEDYARLKDEVERLRIAGGESEPRFVLLSDYRHLKAERDDLKAEVDVWKDMVTDSGVACNERARENQDLENKIERLKAEVERLTAIVGADAIDREHGMCCDASAQVERLTKAGDAMAEIFKNEMDNEPDCVGYLQEKLVNRWLAAKEGKPSA